MKRLLRTFLIYVLPMILILAFFEIGLLSVKNSYNMKRMWLEKGLSGYQVLILGTSVPLHDIDPAFLDLRAFNLANGSQSLFYDRQFLLRYVPRMPALRLVVISIDYFSLEYDLSRSSEYWRCFFYERFWGFPLESNRDAWDIKRFSLARLYGHKDALSYARKLFHVNTNPTLRENGFMPEEQAKNMNDLFAEAANRTGLLWSLMDPKRIAVNAGYLKDMVAVLRASGVVPVFVSLPVSAGYFNALDRYEYSRMQEIMKSLSAGTRVPYFNYMTDPRFYPSDYYDADHLIEPGARKFTRILNDEVVMPLLKAGKR